MTRDARKNVHRALLAAVMMVGLVYVLSGYAAAIGFCRSHAKAYAAVVGGAPAECRALPLPVLAAASLLVEQPPIVPASSNTSTALRTP